MENILKNITRSHTEDLEDEDFEDKVLDKSNEKLVTHFVNIYLNLMKSRDNSVLFYKGYIGTIEILKEIIFDFSMSETALNKQITLLLLVIEYENKEKITTNKVIETRFLKELFSKMPLNYKLVKDAIERCIHLIDNPLLEKSRKSIVALVKLNFVILFRMNRIKYLLKN